MALELDHIFVLVSVGAPEAEQLRLFGLSEGSPNVHPGQGTANRRFFFENAMLELIWVEDADEARSDLVAPTGLWERMQWQESGAAPFGICLRDRSGAAPELPFPTWAYRPPYLPLGSAIAIAAGMPLAEPLLFASPFGRRPAAAAPEEREPLQHPAGMRELTACRLTLAASTPPSAALRSIAELGVISVRDGDAPLLELWFDGGSRRQQADLRDALPLIMHW
jgi:hypothetical protein